MSVIIKGMKMPKSCDSCDLIQFDDDNLRHYKDYKPPTIIEAEVNE